MLQVEAMPTCGFSKSASIEADGPQHRTARGLFDAVDDEAGKLSHIDASGFLFGHDQQFYRKELERAGSINTPTGAVQCRSQ